MKMLSQTKKPRLTAVCAVALLALGGCETPQQVQDGAGFAATTVNSYRSRLKDTLREADEAAAVRRQIALEALERDVELGRDVAIAQIVEIETDGDKKAMLSKMKATAEAVSPLLDEPAEAKAFRDRVAKILPSNAASFPELQRTEASLTALSRDLDDEATLKFLFTYAKAVASAMKEQAKAPAKDAAADGAKDAKK